MRSIAGHLLFEDLAKHDFAELYDLLFENAGLLLKITGLSFEIGDVGETKFFFDDELEQGVRYGVSFLNLHSFHLLSFGILIYKTSSAYIISIAFMIYLVNRFMAPIGVGVNPAQYYLK